jgi:hypothetical protein
MSPLLAGPARMMRDIRALCDDIGVRLAGTAGEAKAAEHIAAAFSQIGLQSETQTFPCLTYAPRQEELRVRVGGRWRASRCTSVAHSPSTPLDGIEAPLVYLGKGTAEELARADTRGAIGLMWGTIGGGAQTLERLCACGLAALLMVDERYPMDWPIAVGLPAGWIKLLTIPAAAVPYTAAWEIVRSGATHAALNLQVDVKPSVSQNVVAELPGDEGLPPLVISGHHDTVINCAGADDNAAGIACTLEAARLLSGQRLRRPVRFVAFGAEEQLSEGARMYALEPTNRAAETALAINADAIGTWAGEDFAFVTGPRGLLSYVRRATRRAGLIATVKGEISPYSDQYPFNRLGVPSVWFYRMNTASGRWHHHATHDNSDVISPEVLATTATAMTHIAHDLALRDELPFGRQFPASQREAILRYERDVFAPYSE